MAAVNLPDNPANGTTQTVGGITYTYNSSKGYWTAAASSGGGGGGASVTTDDTAPGSPSDGDLWYDTDDGGMFVYYQDTDSSQWVEVIGSQGATGAAGAAGSTSVYATIDALPLTGNTQGDMAHVTANNTLYFWNGSGWYKIALINTNPSISGVTSAYTLATDGTATTVTVTASDPEGLPITYSIASDTSGNIATVSQGTGANTNVFTITPSTNTAYAGSFTLTFRASDGVNIATAPATFTLGFSIANSRYTTALITTSGSAGTNSTFTDSSSNSHTVTAGGNAAQTTFSPYRHGGYSHYYTASLNEYHTATISAIGTSWTIEGWFYKTGGVNSGIQVAGHIGAINATNGCSWGIEDTQIVFRANGTTDSTFSVSSTTNRWIHLAFDYDGTTLTCYVNGVSIGTASRTLNITETLLNIGYYNNSYTYEGYIKDMRISTTRRYTAAFTALTEEYGTDSNTDILVRNQPFIRDISSNSRAITASGTNGTHSQKPFSPFDYQSEYAVGDNGGSVYLDGTGDYLDVTSSAANLGTGDFTVECWAYWSADPRSIIYDTRQADGNSGHAIFMTSSTHNVVFYDNNATVLTSAGAVKRDNWNHIAVVRNSGTINIFINGKKDTAQATGNTTNFDAHTFRIGQKTYGGLPNVTGNITDFRISSTARYTVDFTPATTALTSDGNTSLLLNMQGAKIFDKSQSCTRLDLQSGATSSTTQYKYLPTSIDFTSSLAYLQPKEHLHEMFAGDYTIEAWIWSSDIDNDGTNNMALIDFRPFNTNGQYFSLWAKANRKLGLYINSAYRIESNTLLTDSTWHHIAISRQSGTTRMFIDGTLQTQTWSDTTNYSGFSLGRPLIGNSSYHVTNASFDWNGYMSDIRFTKGLARYTANFTAPTAALKG